MTFLPYPLNFPDEAPNSPRGVPVSFAVVIMAGIFALIINAHIDSDILRTVSSVLIFSGIIALGEVRYKQCKSLFYGVFSAAIVTGIVGSILISAFFDWLH